MRRQTLSAVIAAVVTFATITTNFAAAYATVEAVSVDGLLITVDDTADLDRVRVDIAEAININIEEINVIEELGVIAVPAGVRTAAIASVDGVERVETDAVAWALPVTPNDPFYGPFQWGLRVTNTNKAWNRTTGSATVNIAVLDTGVTEVSELVGALEPGYDFVNNDADPTDDNGHGTQSAVVIAARGNNASGVAGVCWTCRITPVKVLGANGSGSHSAIADGIVWATDQGVDIINLSLGGTSTTTVLDNAVTYAVNAGVLVLAAAGNNGLDQAFYPAESPGAVSVAASDENDARYSWSNFGTSRTDIAAPGCNVAQKPDGLFYWYCGTSSATPFAAGVAALAIAANPDITVNALAQALKDTAVPNNFTIHGRIDTEALLYSSQAVDPVPPSVTFANPLPNQYLSGVFNAIAVPVDNASIQRVRLYVGNSFAGETTSAPWTVTVNTTSFSAGAQTLRWRVFDRADNIGVVQRTVFFDNAAPTVTFTTPTPTQPVRGVVSVGANPVDDAGVHRVVLYANDSLIGTTWQSPHTINWDTAAFDEGPVTLKWRVFDRTGKVGVVERTVVVDRTAPQSLVTWPNPGRVVRGVIGVLAAVSDDRQVATTSLIVNGDIHSIHPGTPNVITFDTTGFDGRVELVVRAVDRAGNVTFSPIRVIIVDNTSPAVSFTSPTPSQMMSGTAAVTAQVVDNVAVSRVRLYVNEQFVAATTSEPWSVQWDTTTVANGTVTLKWVVFDTAGNRAVRSRTVTVDNTGPSATTEIT